MQHIMTCTTEELALLITLCGYPAVAKSIAEASLGEKSEQEWMAVMDSAARQLMAKQYWDFEKEARDEIPLSDELQRFIVQYVQSDYMLRCSNAPMQNVLLFHYIEKDAPWVVHIIDRDIIHEFSYISQEELSSIIRDYYDYRGNSLEVGRQFQLSDEAFDLLQDKAQLERVKEISALSSGQLATFQHFIQDLEEKDWILNNISLFSIPEQDEPRLLNIVFFLPSSAGVWIIEYTDHEETPVLIQLSSSTEWEQLLQFIGHMELSE